MLETFIMFSLATFDTEAERLQNKTHNNRFSNICLFHFERDKALVTYDFTHNEGRVIHHIYENDSYSVTLRQNAYFNSFAGPFSAKGRVMSGQIPTVNLRSIQATAGAEQEADVALQQTLQDFAEGTNPGVLFVWGKVGVGKTQAAALLAQRIVKNGRNIAFYDAQHSSVGLENELTLFSGAALGQLVMSIPGTDPVIIIDDLRLPDKGENFIQWSDESDGYVWDPDVAHFIRMLNLAITRRLKIIMTANHDISTLLASYQQGHEEKKAAASAAGNAKLFQNLITLYVSACDAFAPPGQQQIFSVFEMKGQSKRQGLFDVLTSNPLMSQQDHIREAGTVQGAVLLSKQEYVNFCSITGIDPEAQVERLFNRSYASLVPFEKRILSFTIDEVTANTLGNVLQHLWAAFDRSLLVFIITDLKKEEFQRAIRDHEESIKSKISSMVGLWDRLAHTLLSYATIAALPAAPQAAGDISVDPSSSSAATDASGSIATDASGSAAPVASASIATDASSSASSCISAAVVASSMTAVLTAPAAQAPPQEMPPREGDARQPGMKYPAQ